MALELIEIKDFPKTTTLIGSGEEIFPVSKADGKTYGIKSSDFKAFLGTVQSIAPRPIAPADPAPTIDTVYIPTVTQNEAGTPIVYSNTGGLSVNTAVGGADYGNKVEFIKNGSVWVKSSYPLPQTDIVNNLTSGGVNSALSAQQGVTLNENKIGLTDLTKESQPPTHFTEIYDISKVVSGYWMVLSNNKVTKASTLNWISYPPITDVNEGDILVIQNYFGLNAPVALITDNDDLVLEEVTSPSPENYKEITIPVGASKVYFNLAAQAGIGNDPTNNTLNISIKRATSVDVIAEIKNSKLKASALSNDIKFLGEVSSPKTPATKEYVDLLSSGKQSLLSGYGSPHDGIGVSNDKYLDLYTNRYWLNTGGYWGFIENAGDEVFQYPDGFSYHPFEIIKQQNKMFTPKFKGIYNEFIKAKAVALTQYYIDPVNGLDSNNGLTETSALKTISYAVLTKGARNIILLPCQGLYNRASDIGTLTDISTSEPLIIRAKNGTTVNMGGAQKANTLTWLPSAGCFTTTRSIVAGVLDSNQVDANGNYVFLTQVTSLALCQSTVNSWFIEGSTLAVHNSDGTQPGANIEILLTVGNTYIPSENIPYIYIEGVNFYTNQSEGNLCMRNNTTTQFNTKTYVSNCKGVNNSQGNSFSFDNFKESWVENCKAYKPRRDGFNYHTSKAGYIPMNAVEINCYAENTGLDYTAETSANGSTAHEGISIIRMNCYYNTARGGIVADVGASKSLNLNVRAYNSILDSSGVSFLASDAGSVIWLYSCVGKNSIAANKSASTNSAIYYDYETILPNGTFGNVILVI